MASSLQILFLTLSLYTLQTLYILSSYAQLVSDFKVNDDISNYSQSNPRVAVDKSGNFIVTWTDFRNNEGNIYCQLFDNKGKFINSNFKVNITEDYSIDPDISIDSKGQFAICWLDNLKSNIKVRFFLKNGIPKSDPIIVNDSLGDYFDPPSIFNDSNGNFYITFKYKPNFNDPQIIFFQKFDTSCNKVNSNVRVDNTIYPKYYPQITGKPDGSLIITWFDRRRPPHSGGTEDIFLQKFDRFGNKIGVNEIVNDDTSTTDINSHIFPKISCDSSGAFVIAWNDDRLDNTEGEVFAQLFDKNGNKINNNFRVTQSTIDWTKGLSSVSKRENGDFVICWTEFRSNGQPYFQRFNNNGNFIGGNYLITNQSPTTEKFYSNAKISNDRVISVWSDYRNGNSDIYCNIRSYKNPDSTVRITQISNLIPDNFDLYQNYPNPFNNTTIIKFDILEKGIYSLNIYNLLGQNIYEIFNRNAEAGSYKVSYNASSLTSGVYIYSLSNGYEKLLKYFVILK